MHNTNKTKKILKSNVTKRDLNVVAGTKREKEVVLLDGKCSEGREEVVNSAKNGVS